MHSFRALAGVTVIVLALVSSGCGDDDDDDDMDSTTDSSMDSAQQMDTTPSNVDCMDFCTMMQITCAAAFDDTWMDQAACETDCDAQSDSVQACWDLHLGFAQAASPATHCRHAVGDPSPSAGTSPDCKRP